ncbi:uncharacterized protein PHACADRAFT_255209 [Phanerochaete carnosa HHB-10118-sp]|uniref:Uncharacterized protein n=1 Tax=Phanerochaete carnosa (strain HHB-10118-sp) TaxID=650164 RepID=K5VTY1_PHACS|nr:uncharacterized protein PHACADRAFT_255209 [Phanerochaete carnosa HHB-10118-sp]EKM54958.1 hypothetical protein PHACADRAFT_255209 [Phanerochaete carnosa HHB-10118-sp]
MKLTTALASCAGESLLMHLLLWAPLSEQNTTGLLDDHAFSCKHVVCSFWQWQT